MHIVQVINALRAGGAEKLIVTFARAIQGTDHRLTVITLRKNVAATEQEVLETGAQVVHFHHRKLYNLGRFRRLVAFCKAESCDVIHTHLTMANILGGAAGYLAHVPVTATLHNTTMSSAERPLHRYLENLILRRVVRRPIAVGWRIAEAHADRIGANPITVIPNAVTIPEPLPPAARTAMRQSLLNGDEATTTLLIAIGRLETQKGFTNLLDAFAQVQTSHSQTRLLIAGIGALQDELAAKITALGLDKTVQLLGLRHDVPQLLAASDIYVSSSWWEGLPVATLEAMAAGLPIVATSVGDLPQVVTPALGQLVPPKEPQALATALCHLLNHPEQRQQMGIAARETAVADYSATVWANKLIALYSDIQTR